MQRTARLFRVAALAALAAGGTAFAQPCPPDPCVNPISPTMPTTPLPPFTPGATLTNPVSGVPSDAGESASFGGTLGGAGVGPTAAVSPGAYIDGAAPTNMFRLRYDAAYESNRPDRAEMFYPKCGCFLPLRNVPESVRNGANGPPKGETNVDYQEVSAYLETKLADRLSVFADVPVRFINPAQNANASGLGDVSFGFKYALVGDGPRLVTFQLRATAPSGDGFKGLGTENWSIEPGLLFQDSWTDRLTVFGEIRDRIPVDRNSDFAGNVLRYGIGARYDVYCGPRATVAVVNELVGWSVLSGKELNVDTGGTIEDATGATIVNAKSGVWIGFKDGCGGLADRSSLYLGYGRAITGEVWYKELLRVEYRLKF